MQGFCNYRLSSKLFRNHLRISGLRKRDHHILVLSTGYNGLTQRVHTFLADRGHDVTFRLAVSSQNISETVNAVKPDFVLCPFLQQKIPEDVCKHHLCLVFHPGIPGDGGPHAIDWAILNKEKEWGGILLQATDELDAGDIWAAVTFKVTSKTKASVYRTDMTEVAVDCVNTFLAKYDSLTEKTPEQFATVTNKISDFAVQGQWRDPAKQDVRKVDWRTDTMEDIIRKVNGSDSTPGVAEHFFGRKLFMYGAHKEGVLRGAASQIIATRKGAICLGTKDGAVWITHLREPKGGTIPYKLPATMVLGEEHLMALGVQESEYNPFNSKYGDRDTFRDVWYEEYGEVGVIHFDFHNGAMSTEQCRDLRQAYLTAKQRSIKVLVLMGGKDFFSNGIHLNMIEASTDPTRESWNNINAINGVVREILTNTNQITISAVEGNAGAGGVFLAIASDKVWASETSVLNPHYKTMGLFGSEYSTFTTPQRIGEEKANLLKDQCLPISAERAEKIKLIDEVVSKTLNFKEQVLVKAGQLLGSFDEFILRKKSHYVRSKYDQAMVGCEANELKKMYDNFNSEVYHTARKNFVYKAPTKETPHHLVNNKINNAIISTQTRGNILDGNKFAAQMKHQLSELILNLQKKDATFQPGLAIVQVGNREDSNVYVNKKLAMAKKIGINAVHLKLPRDTTEHQLIMAIDELNNENHIHGIMLQLPLDCSNDIKTSEVLNFVAPRKDVDAIGSTNLGNIMSGDLSGTLTCTPAACMELIMKSGIMIQGSRAVVVGRSVVVGGTVAEMLKWHNATVVTCHEYTANIQAEISSADILVAAAGIPNYIQGSWIKEGAVVIDCGINTIPDHTKRSGYRIVGDVEYETASKRAAFITPVPGGIGPMTVQMLMRNTVKAAVQQHFSDKELSGRVSYTTKAL